MSYFQKIRETYKESVVALQAKLEDGQEVQLIETRQNEDGYTDEFYELPQLTWLSKHSFALTYYIHSVKKVGEDIIVIGTDIEEAETREFKIGDLDYGTACFVADLILE